MFTLRDTRTRTHTHTHTHTQAHKHTRAHTHTRMHAHTQTHRLTNTHTHTDTHTCSQTHTGSHTHTRMHARTHTHTHTHTQVHTYYLTTSKFGIVCFGFCLVYVKVWCGAGANGDVNKVQLIPLNGTQIYLKSSMCLRVYLVKSSFITFLYWHAWWWPEKLPKHVAYITGATLL